MYGIQHRQIRNKGTDEMKSAGKLYFDEKINAHDRNPRKKWKTPNGQLGPSSKFHSEIESLNNDGSVVSDDTLFVKYLNELFCGIGEKFNPNYLNVNKNGSFLQYMQVNHIVSFKFKPNK